MRFGVWTPLPHTIRPEPLMNVAIRESGTRGLANGPDKAFRFAVDMITRAEELGFETTLLAERWIGTDHPAWMLASALAPLTRKIELMVAVHPGIITPQVVAKFAVVARPHQRRACRHQHRQRLVEGGVRDLRPRRLAEGRRCALPADGRVRARHARDVERGRVRFPRRILHRRAPGASAEINSVAQSADLCREPATSPARR